MRRLLVETPSVVAGDVDDESWAWLRQSQRRETTILGDAVGLDLEIRAEGVLAIDPAVEGVSSRHFANRKEATINTVAMDTALARRFCEESAALVGVAPTG